MSDKQVLPTPKTLTASALRRLGPNFLSTHALDCRPPDPPSASRGWAAPFFHVTVPYVFCTWRRAIAGLLPPGISPRSDTRFYVGISLALTCLPDALPLVPDQRDSITTNPFLHHSRNQMLQSFSSTPSVIALSRHDVCREFVG